ncbi:flagellar filament capping protein FliD [Lysinibacillus sp. NPDC098008]|uniref:flagellar filament capping protein FliD n=1 Tax=Lysinibacillus sp. NPDC098008 TaxID=3364146 RepID=UPI0037F95F09
MVMRIGGLASGMDIDALVEKLMNAEKAPLNKLLQNKQRYEWQRDAYRDVNNKLRTFDTYIADNLVLKNLNTKTASSSNSDLVSAIATSKATGTLSIEGVSQLASAARTTSGQIDGTGSTKMSDLVGSDTKFIEFTAPTADGSNPTSVKVAITSNMTVDSFIEKVNESNAGVSAIFENGRFSFTAQNTGKGDITVNGVNANGTNTDISKLKLQEGEGATVTEGKNAIFQVNGIATERNSNTFTLNGYNITLKKTFNDTATNVNKYLAAQTEFTNATAAKADLDTKATTANQAFNTASLAYQDKLNNVFKVGFDDTEKAAYNRFNQSFLANLTDDEISELGNLPAFDQDDTFEDMLAKISADSTISEDLKEKLHTSLTSKEQLETLKDLDATALTKFRTEANREVDYASLNKSFLSGLTADEIDVIASLDLSKDDPFEGLSLDADLQASVQAKLASLSTAQKEKLDTVTKADLTAYSELAQLQIVHDEKRVAKNSADAALTAGEARLTNATAAFASAKAEAEAAGILEEGTENIKEGLPTNPTEAAVTLSSTTNVDDMMNKIKDFVNMYNAFVTDLKDQTTQTKYRDYAPLTEDQKKDMKENEIKLWEEKAKSGLLRNDSILRDGLSKMRSLVYETVPGLEDSKFQTLFSIGITTTKNYNDGGTLEIDEKKLREALEEDPDAVARLFKNDAGNEKDTVNGQTVDTRGYLARLRSSMDEFKISIEQKAGRATMTEQQYTLGKNLIDTEKRISTWQDKLKNIEARYWKQFTAMEQAINKANQQSGLFMQNAGGGF